MSDDDSDKSRVRLDKWLWAARFFKTRSLAAEEIAKGRIQVNGQAAKASREVREGDRLEIRQLQVARTVLVKGLSHVRGPAPVAQALYQETEESIARAPGQRSNAASAPSRPRPSSRAARPSATGAAWPTGSAGAPRPSRRAAAAAERRGSALLPQVSCGQPGRTLQALARRRVTQQAASATSRP